MQHWPWYLLIDESFVGLSGIRGDLIQRSHLIRQRVLQWTGLPTCVGIAPTKTLAKLANHIAKTVERKPGVYPEHIAGHGPDGSLAQVCHLGLLTPADRQTLFERTEVGEVWGVGRRLGKQLQAAGMATVWDLVRMDAATVGRRWSVVLERTVRELQGTPCVALEHAPPPKQQIAFTRSFGHTVTGQDELKQAITEFTSRAAEKLRHQALQAGQILVFIRTSPFRRQDEQYSRSLVCPLHRPTQDTAVLVRAALESLQAIYRPGFNYAKAGVMLLELSPQGMEQAELNWDDPDVIPSTGNLALPLSHSASASSRVMAALDALNSRYGRGTVRLACGDIEHKPVAQTGNWRMKQERRTPRYTTHWAELAEVRG